MRRLLFFGGFIFLFLFFLSACAPRVGLERPNGVAVAADNSLYIMDFGHYRVVHAAENGKIISTAGAFGSGAGQIFFGWDMAIDGQGRIYFGNTVRDDAGTRHDGVKVYSPEGKFLREIGGEDYPRDAEQPPHQPYGIDVDSQGRVYTADYGMAAVRIFSPAGTLLGTLSAAGQSAFQLVKPGDVAVDDQRSLLYVTDFTRGSLLQFKLAFTASGTPELTFLKPFGEYGRKPGQFAFPQSLAVDEKSGTVYVGDLANRRIQAFSAQGDYLSSYAPPDVADWQVIGLTVAADGRVFAGDALNNVIWVFSGPAQPVERVEVTP